MLGLVIARVAPSSPSPLLLLLGREGRRRRRGGGGHGRCWARCLMASRAGRAPGHVPAGGLERGVKRALCVAEKNDAAKGIADIMSRGGFTRREGLSKFNKIYEYNYSFSGQNVNVVMTSVSGHLLGLEFIAGFRNWRGCHPVDLFDAEIEKICPDDFVTIKRTLEREVRQCQALIIWTDCDREGENIGFEIIDVCKAVKPNLQVFRARFSEITQQSIHNACRNLTLPDANTSKAVDVRQELDLRIGAAFTRFQTLRLQKIFPASLAHQLVSYGSCQFPTLGFVVERFKSIQAFIPEAFHQIKVTHQNEDGLVEFHWKRNRLFNHTACLILYQLCIENPTAEVLDVTCKPKSKWRPQPLDTVEMEKLASRKLKINAKETMKIAEKLYTKGFISYPRTETNVFPKGMNLAALVEMQTQDRNWGAFAQRLLEAGPNPRNGTKSDQAHPPIHPTKYTAELNGNDQRLYEFIVRHFLACCSQDAQGQETTVEIEIAGERFFANGLMITARNYLDVYPYDKWNAKVIPVYTTGVKFQPSNIEMTDGETSPPQLLSEADLISLMEKHGIGTDATHADHIETIKSRMYVGLTPAQRFLPGELGMGLVEGYDAMGYEMSKPDLRAELEADLKLICEGKKNNTTVLQQQIQKYKQVFLEAVSNAEKLDEALSCYLGEPQQSIANEETIPRRLEPVRKCPQCKSNMVLKQTKDGKFMLTCLGFPNCRAAVFFPDFVLEATRDESICQFCQPNAIHRLKFKFKKNSVIPCTPLDYVGCVGGCDDVINDIADLKYLRPVTTPNQSRQSQPSASVARQRGTCQPSNAYVQRPPQQAPPPPMAMLQIPPGRNEENAVVCNCGIEATLLTVKKEGINKGRMFYKCPSGVCNFFLWADQQDSGYRSAQSNQGSFHSSTVSRGGHDEVMCSCNNPAVMRTIVKDGPNKGRQFYTCSKPRDEQCGFFLWMADEPSNSAHSVARPPLRPDNARPTSNNRTAGEDTTVRAKRTCGICHQPGHRRTTCPMNK
ncbi:DNA topoisomerase 3-alpha isoform X2 [Lethenteron reissneri]|uniref:DNA topoisomerase 3-alpha isoform X2 n=1 Tax=Lethenteron reissneri TaxID=7753 RepID=UPI002AB60E0E|nr:DNA topoisomerase 3-alpha isoform X2 [Lethenteron reissneri]